MGKHADAALDLLTRFAWPPSPRLRRVVAGIAAAWGGVFILWLAYAGWRVPGTAPADLICAPTIAWALFRLLAYDRGDRLVTRLPIPWATTRAGMAFLAAQALLSGWVLYDDAAGVLSGMPDAALAADVNATLAAAAIVWGVPALLCRAVGATGDTPPYAPPPPPPPPDPDPAPPADPLADAYRTLALDPSASADALKRRYRALAARWHPDTGTAAERPERTRRMAAINSAYASIEAARREWA